MSWIWRNFLVIICYPFMSTSKHESINEYYHHKYVVRKRKKRMKKTRKKINL